MMLGPEGCVLLDYWAERHRVDALTLELAIATGSLVPVMHDGKRWVHSRRAGIWLASEPASPSGFALLEPMIGGTPLVPAPATADPGEAA